MRYLKEDSLDDFLPGKLDKKKYINLYFTAAEEDGDAVDQVLYRLEDDISYRCSNNLRHFSVIVKNSRKDILKFFEDFTLACKCDNLRFFNLRIMTQDTNRPKPLDIWSVSINNKDCFSLDPERLTAAVMKNLQESRLYKGNSIREASSKEEYGALNAQFNNAFTMTPKAEAYEDDFLSALEDAKDGDADAEIYLINKSKKTIFHVFWTNFIGKEAPKKVIAMRIANDEFNDFLALVYIAFNKAIKAFKPDVYDDIKIGNFQYYLGRYLKAEAVSWNLKEKEDPINDSIHPDEMTSETESKGDGTGNAWDTLVGGVEDESTLDFIEDWKDFAKSPEMNEPFSKKVKTPRRKILARILGKEKSIPEIADELGVTKTTIYGAINSISSVLKNYSIDKNVLAKVLKSSPDTILKPLKR